MSSDQADESNLSRLLRPLAAQPNSRTSAEQFERLICSIESNGPSEEAVRLFEHLIDLAPPDYPKAAAWCELGRLAAARESLQGFERAATYHWRAEGLVSPSQNAELWAMIHTGLGIAYSGQARAHLGTSNDRALECLVHAEKAFSVALSVLMSDSTPQGDESISSLHAWTQDSIAKLKCL